MPRHSPDPGCTKPPRNVSQTFSKRSDHSCAVPGRLVTDDTAAFVLLRPTRDFHRFGFEIWNPRNQENSFSIFLGRRAPGFQIHFKSARESGAANLWTQHSSRCLAISARAGQAGAHPDRPRDNTSESARGE